jgi:hypothetical protein
MTDSDLTLETLAQNFKAWKGTQQHRAYPRQFWEDINLLSKHYSISDIAQALGINATFLRQKLRKKSHKFAPVHLKTFYSIASLEFFTAFSERAMTVRFQTDHEQLVRMIISLSGYKL